EGTASGDGEKYRWIVDPLDGTTNFMHGVPPYSVSIALKEGKEILLGVIYIASSGELFHAISGCGAWLNGKKISTSGAESVSNSLIATGFPYRNFTRLGGFMKCLEHFIRNSHGVRRMGSAAVDLAFVACGRFDAFFEYNLNPWDVSAGILLVREAGGRVSDFSGNEDDLTGMETVATNGHIFDEFSGIVGRFMKE
ncbi:MAG: inositol monophosphatase family protein, partial [Bacteroidales bacterium]